MLDFRDRRNQVYHFDICYFSWPDDDRAPPNRPGCYLILDPNADPEDGIGTHSVLYAGKSLNVRNRMFGHSQNPRRFVDIGRWGLRWKNYVVLYADADQPGVHFSTKENDRFPDRLEKLEQRLKFLFVPLARCCEHQHSSDAGRSAGNTNQVFLNMDTNEVRWAFPPCELTPAA